jgi:endonuclease YncB( thermonuclease family)
VTSIFGRALALAAAALLTILAIPPDIRATAGDSLYGRVTAVKGANLITFDYGAGTYDVRLAGIEFPRTRTAADAATQFMTELLLNKNARLRFEGRTPDGEMVGMIFTDDPEIGILDVGVEMVRAGMVMPEAEQELEETEYKYGEMEEAMQQARNNRLGIWGGQ